MQSIDIACPQCGSLLKLKDRKLLGRRGKCAKCGHMFIMKEPEPVVLEPVNETALFVTPLAEPAKSPILGGLAIGDAASPNPAIRDNGPGLNLITEPASPGMVTFQEIRQRNRKSSRIAWEVTIATGLLLMLAVWWFAPQFQQAIDPSSSAQADANTATTRVIVEKTDDLLRKEELEKNFKFAKAQSPTAGEPIDMHFIPAGSRIIFHLRPADLWEEGGLAQEVRYCLGPVAEWAEAKIREICLREPKEIEEALICLALGSPSMPPEISAVVHLKQELKPSDFVKMFQGKPNDEFGYKVTIANDRAFMIADESGKIFTTCPAHLAQEMVEARGRLQPTDPAIEAIVADTDRDRHFTLIFTPIDLMLAGHQETLLPAPAQPFFTGIIDWLGEDVEALAWSVHLGEEFRSDVVIRSDAKLSVMRTQRRYQNLLDELPTNVLALVKQMNPAKVGVRKVVGRFPAMLKALQMATLISIDERHVLLSAQLPERAAPNLALGTLLTWDESTRTAFSADGGTESAAIAAANNDDKLPEKVADRLKKKIDVDFRRTPLQEAFDYIADETSVKIEIDGDALKLSGYTKNMAQTYKLNQQTGLAVIKTIFKPYPKMCLVIDEEKKVAIITTYPAAEDRKLKPLVFE
ncbi:MAG: zinc-ribbon domain-containing protein [Planctomycetaceae bacterium]